MPCDTPKATPGSQKRPESSAPSIGATSRRTPMAMAGALEHTLAHPKAWFPSWSLRLKLPLAVLLLGLVITLGSSSVLYLNAKALLQEQAAANLNQHLQTVETALSTFFNNKAQTILQLSQMPSAKQLAMPSNPTTSPPIQITDNYKTYKTTAAKTALVDYFNEFFARDPSLEQISILSTKHSPAIRLQITRLASGRLTHYAPHTSPQASTKFTPNGLTSNKLPPKKTLLERPLVAQALRSTADTVWHQSVGESEHIAKPIFSEEKLVGVIHLAFNANIFLNQIQNEMALTHHLKMTHVTPNGRQSDSITLDTRAPIIGEMPLRATYLPGDQETSPPTAPTPQLTQEKPTNADDTLTRTLTLAVNPKTGTATQQVQIQLRPEQSQQRLAIHYVTTLLIGTSFSLIAFVLAIIATRTLLRPLSKLIDALRSDPTINGRQTLASDMDEGVLLTQATGTLYEEKREGDEKMQALALELEKAYHRVDVAEKFKNHFLASMSHEVRTPLNGVLGMLDLIRRNQLSEEQACQVDLAYTSADALLKIINDIIDYSDLETNTLTLTPNDFNLRELLNKIEGHFIPLAQEKHLNFSIGMQSDCGYWLSGDSARIEQLISRLISNAIKFTSRGHVRVSIHLKEEGEIGRRLFCSVLDTGIGITPNQTNALFEAFTKQDNSLARSQNGIGVGLTIAKQLCHLMHGGISVESERGKGSRFSFDILLRACSQPGKSATNIMPIPSEISPPQPSSSNAPSQGAPVKSQHRILIVEDDPICQELLQELLADIDIKSDITADGHDALERLRRTEHKHLYDLILMDCNLPNINGYDTTQQIRAGNSGIAYAHVPIIAITSNNFNGVKQKCLDAGMSDYLPKPIEHQAFYNLVRQWLSIARQQAQLDSLTTHTPRHTAVVPIAANRSSL